MLSHPGDVLRHVLPDPGALGQRRGVHAGVHPAAAGGARLSGCRTLDGTHMAVYQAVDAFGHFTGLAADAERMRATFQSLG
jgi:shikimate dehydrogenase